MLPKPPACAECPLQADGRGFVPAAVPEAAPVLLVQGEAPGADEASHGVPFVGRAGHWLRKNILATAGVDPDRVVLDNTLRCLPPAQRNGAAYPPAKTRGACEDACRAYDVWDRWPTVPLLLFGGNAARQRLGVAPVSDWHGHIEKRGGRYVGVTFHPAAVMRNPNLLPVVVAEVRSLMDRARRGLPKPPRVAPGAAFPVLDRPFVTDLEWDAESRVTVVGVAQSPDAAYSTWNVEYGLEQVRRALDAAVPVIGHNIIDADLPRIAEPRNYESAVFDTMLAAHLVHPHLAGAGGTGDAKDTGVGLLGLGDLVRMCLGIPNWKEDKADLLTYNGRDCAYNYALYEVLRRDLEATKQTHLLGKQQRLARLARSMHERGVRVDAAECERIGAAKKALRADVGTRLPFNPNSPKQVREWFAERGVRLPDTSRTTVEKAAAQYPKLASVWEPLLALKADWKTLSTWFPEGADQLFPRFHVTGTAVARFSSSGPNFQNLPPALRRLVLPPEGALWAALDYSQLENRIIAWLAQDAQALADYASGLDVHRQTAARIEGKPASEITPEERHRAKTVVHATGYLETKHHLAERLYGNRSRESVAKASALQERYFSAYPGIRRWHNSLSARLEAGRVQFRNPFGRWRCIYAQNAHERAKRAAHFLGCSTGADLMNQRVLDVHETLGIVPSLIVHDEIVFAVEPGDAGRRVVAQVAEIMSAPVPELGGLRIPVEVKIGANYGKASADNPQGLRALEGK